MNQVLRQAGDVSGRVVVSCSLPMNADDTRLVAGRTSSGAEKLARKLPRARLVAAFGTVPSEVLFGVFESRKRAPVRAWCITVTTRRPRKWPRR